MKRFLIVLALAGVMVLTACSYNEHMQKADSDYYTSQKDAKKPLFELVAAEGQTIELKGVKSLTVNDPRASEIRPMVRDAHPGWKIADRITGGIVSLGQAWISGDTIKGVAGIVADSAGDRSTHSYIDQSDHSDNSVSVDDSYNSDDDTSGDTDSNNTDVSGVIVADSTDVAVETGEGDQSVKNPDSSNPGNCDGVETCNPVTNPEPPPAAEQPEG